MKAVAIINEASVSLSSAYTLIAEREIKSACREDKSCDITIVVEQMNNTILHVVVQYTDK